MIEQKKNVSISETPAEKKSLNDMEALVGTILLIGVLLSVTLIIAGTLWNWGVAHTLTTQFSIAGMNYFGFLTSSLRQLFAGAFTPHLLISLGIVALMFTPYLRVAASLIYFAFVSHNLKYTVFTFIVFTVLTYSLFLR
jgi:uncharacterized membrane protein